TIAPVDVGTYSIISRASCYVNNTVVGVHITGHSTTTQNVSLTPSCGGLTGKITDSLTGHPIGGAVVTTTPGSYAASTDSGGVYRIPSMPKGTYSLTATKSCYATTTSIGVKIMAGSNTKNMSLAPSCGSVTGKVTDS